MEDCPLPCYLIARRYVLCLFGDDTRGPILPTRGWNLQADDPTISSSFHARGLVYSSHLLSWSLLAVDITVLPSDMTSRSVASLVELLYMMTRLTFILSSTCSISEDYTGKFLNWMSGIAYMFLALHFCVDVDRNNCCVHLLIHAGPKLWCCWVMTIVKHGTAKPG